MDAEVIVVDNASKDGSVEYLRDFYPEANYPHLTIVASDENLGFGRANNLALQKARGEYILFLNPDTVLTEHTLADCLAFARQHEDMGALGVRMLKDNGSFAPESRRGLPTPWVSFCKVTGLTALFPRSRTFGRYYQNTTPQDQACPIDIVSGAFMMVRRSILEEVGGFDEQFFMYGEDIDLSYRILQAGYQNYYCPTPILHYKGESTQKDSLRYVQHFHEAMLFFYRKHFHRSHRALSFFVESAIRLRAFIHRLKRKTPKVEKEQLTGILSFRGYYYEFKYLPSEGAIINLDVPSFVTGDSGIEDASIYCYDTRDFTYAEILDEMINSNHKHFVGFFYYPLQKLITAGGNYTVVPPNRAPHR